MKKLMAALLSAAMVLGLTACLSDAVTPPQTQAAAPAATQAVAPAETTAAAAAPAETKAPETQPAAPDFPTKTIQCIIPYAPGGGSDILTRAIMSTLKLPNDQVLAAINVEGAAGFTGCMQASMQPNDGYFILAHNPMDVVSYSLSGIDETAMYKNLEMICCVVADYNVFSTNKQTGLKTVDEVVEYAKAHPGELKMAVTGTTTVNFADANRLLRDLGIADCVTIVPHNGGADCMTALLGNHVQLCFESSVDSRATIDSGDTIPLMTIGTKRAQYLPDVACSAELGYSCQTAKPRGYYAPAGTDPEKIKVIADSIKTAIEQQEFIDTCANLGLEIDFRYADEIQPDIELWAEQLQPIFDELINTQQ